jgi:hypothetical protein
MKKTYKVTIVMLIVTGLIIVYFTYPVFYLVDYDTYNDKQFYYHLSWELGKFVKRANFRYCFMNEDVNIELQ